MQAWQVDSKNVILASNSCLREIEIRRDFEDTLEPPTPEFLDEILASLSATTVRSFTPNDDAICIDREFKVFFFDRGQFNLDDQASAVEVYLSNADSVDTLRPAIETAINRQALITTWRERNVTFFSALEVERNVM